MLFWRVVKVDGKFYAWRLIEESGLIIQMTALSEEPKENTKIFLEFVNFEHFFVNAKNFYSN